MKRGKGILEEGNRRRNERKENRVKKIMKGMRA